jgi:hypothetical protein
MKAGRILLPVVLLLLSACGSVSKSQPAAAWPVSGNWQMSLQKNAKAKPKAQSGFLLESQTAISGSVLFAGASCAGVGNVTGTASGSNVSLTITPTGLSIELTGTLGSDQASMSGTYTILALGCGAPESGTWTGQLVKPLNGNVLGTFISKGGASYSISGQLSQGQNGGAPSALLSGSLDAAGYDCFTTANVSGLISGTNVVVNLADSAGSPVGQVIGTITPDATSITGTYKIVQQGSPGSPCHNGDSGTFAFTL